MNFLDNPINKMDIFLANKLESDKNSLGYQLATRVQL